MRWGRVARQAKQVDYLTPGSAAGGLGRTAARGTAVTLLGQWSGFVMQTLSVVVLARLLTPHDYGIVTGVLVLTGLAELLKDLGLGAATIQRRDLTETQLNSLFWVNLGLGILTAALVAAAGARHAIAQAGYLNRFRHPAASVEARWRQAGAAFWRTDRDGAVLAVSRVAGLQVRAQRAARRYWHAAAP